MQGILKKVFLSALCAGLAFASAVARQSGSPRARLRPAMLVWNVGVEKTGGASKLVETVTASQWEGHETWRVTHYAQDPAISTINDYDLYDLDRISLAPLRSVSNREGGYLELRFSSSGVAIRSNRTDTNWSEHVDLHAAVQPEGPGLTAFVATLPLREGYKLNYQIVDRWSGHDKARIKKMTLEVKSRGLIETGMGKKDSYGVSIFPEDRSFEIRESVLAQGLHWPLHMTYIRGAARVESEVLTIAVSDK